MPGQRRISYRQAFCVAKCLAEGAAVMAKTGVLKEPEAILEKYGDMVFKAAFSLTKNRQDAEDAAQEAFISLMQSAPEFESEEHQKAWLLRVVTNKCKSLFRTVWHSRTQAIEENTASFEMTTDERGVVDAVNSLSQKYKEVVYLYYIEGYSAKEIASILNTTQNTVLSRMARARHMLQNILKETEGESIV